MSALQISKQDYLKKYLSGGHEKKKKKKVTRNSVNKSKIIDDDIDLKDMKTSDLDEIQIYDLSEEAPQIVAIVDERPEEVRLMSEYKNKRKWRLVEDERGTEEVKVTAGDDSDKSKEIKENDNTNRKQGSSRADTPKKSEPSSKKSDSEPRSGQGDSKYSPVRKIKNEKSDSDVSPPRKSSKQYVPDLSPRRKPKKNHEPSPRKIKREKSDSDTSPPRRCKKHSHVPRRVKEEESDSDVSPPRKSRRAYDSDASPPRRSKRSYDSDQSPRRSKKSDAGSPHKRKHHHHSRSSHHKSSGRQKEDDLTFRERDVRKRKSDSPEVWRNHKESGKGKTLENSSKHRIREENHPRDDAKSKNSLTSRKPGLQNAEELKKEIEEMKEKQKEMKLDVSEQSEAAVVRDKETGRRIDPKKEARKRKEIEEKEAEKLAQYAIWGKGVKQLKDGQEKLKDDLYEMSKPLARYADDKDLDDMLKNKEWDGDPMLDYIRKKRKKKESKGESSQKPQYEGAYFPNRYGIKPGHRWDGVDRSNGYEKRWFEEQSARKAREEEAFKWSTADM